MRICVRRSDCPTGRAEWWTRPSRAAALACRGRGPVIPNGASGAAVPAAGVSPGKPGDDTLMRQCLRSQASVFNVALACSTCRPPSGCAPHCGAPNSERLLSATIPSRLMFTIRAAVPLLLRSHGAAAAQSRASLTCASVVRAASRARTRVAPRAAQTTSAAAGVDNVDVSPYDVDIPDVSMTQYVVVLVCVVTPSRSRRTWFISRRGPFPSRRAALPAIRRSHRHH